MLVFSLLGLQCTNFRRKLLKHCHPKNNAYFVSCDESNSFLLMIANIRLCVTVSNGKYYSVISKRKRITSAFRGENVLFLLMPSLCSISLQLIEALQCWEVNTHSWANSPKSNLVYKVDNT